jgi:hypothetical protein
VSGSRRYLRCAGEFVQLVLVYTLEYEPTIGLLVDFGRQGFVERRAELKVEVTGVMPPNQGLEVRGVDTETAATQRGNHRPEGTPKLVIERGVLIRRQR